jgi:sugar/nucleoside kinase (ribokinase family)
LFVDLADPEKRSRNDMTQALDLIVSFNRYFDVILGLNEKEAYEVSTVLGLAPKPHTPEGVKVLTAELSKALPVQTLLVHPTTYALAASKGVASLIYGPFTEKPLITTGAGDHFNAGFCLGKLLGFDPSQSLLCGVATSGFYVRTAKSPGLLDLAHLMRNWPAN